jgi:16S rRNA (cytosine967-C5)-methyltransferase
LYNYKYKKIFQHDAAATLSGNEMFDTVICDVPCSGSGTWSRTPEQYYFFETTALAEFLKTQQRILANSWSNVKVGGRLYYVTCSIFADENENQIQNFLDATNNANLEFSTLMDGKKYNSDYMYIACLIKK